MTAAKYDTDYTKARHADLNVMLILVCEFTYLLDIPHLTCLQAGLLSAVSTAFILNIHLKIDPDPNQDSVLLLRAILYTLNNTSRALTQSATRGYIAAIIVATAGMYGSLASSLMVGFLMMMEKKLLSWCLTSVDGPMVERCRNHQHKLDQLRLVRFGDPPQIIQLSLFFAICGFCARTMYNHLAVGLGVIFYLLLWLLLYFHHSASLHFSKILHQTTAFATLCKLGGGVGLEGLASHAGFHVVSEPPCVTLAIISWNRTSLPPSSPTNCAAHSL